jgi:hypothetical protein
MPFLRAANPRDADLHPAASELVLQGILVGVVRSLPR